MTEDKQRFNARLRVTMEFDVGSVWGGDCTMSQIVDQASREGKQGLMNALAHVEKPYSSPKIIGLSVQEVAVVPEKKR